MMRVAVVSIVLLVSAAEGLFADEGRIPIFQPTTISQPGDYFVTQNITGSGSAVVTISTSGHVLLDLNGFTLTASGGSTAGINVFPGGDAASVVIRNGRILGASRGVQFNSQPVIQGRLRLEDLTVRVTGASGEAVIASTPANIEILNCNLSSTATFTVSVYNPNTTGSFTGRLVNNRIENFCNVGGGSTCTALALDGLRGGNILGNVVTGPILAARLVGPNGGSNVLEGNTFIGRLGLDIGSTLGADDNLVINNTFASTENNVCLQIGSSGNRIAGNVVGPGCSDGIVFVYTSTLRNLIEGNQIQGNSGCGLSFPFSSTNAYRSNMLRGNTGGGVCGVANTDAGGNIL